MEFFNTTPTQKHPIWNTVFLLLELACIPLAIWWVPYSHLPEPGWAVAFIAGAAAAMSVHDEMRGWQKLIWLLVIGAFLITEIRAIHKDRVDSDARALADRKAQDTAFQGVRAEQDADFHSTAKGLETAIAGIKTTMETATTTLLQTRPRAAIHFTEGRLHNMPKILGDFLAGTPYGFDTVYINDGSADGTILKIFTGIYVGEPDKEEHQIELRKRFEGEWDDESSLPHAELITPHLPQFHTYSRVFTNTEAKELKTGKTVYFFQRVVYSDSTGVWGTDLCQDFQVVSSVVNTYVAHPCLISFDRDRYQAKKP